MILTIDNFDDAGPRDYTGAIDRETPPVIQRRLHAPAELRAQLRIHDPQLPIPGEHSRIRVATTAGAVLFTGYLAEAPEFEYLGWGMAGPVYRLQLVATGDE